MEEKYFKIVVTDEFQRRNQLFLGQIVGVARGMFKMVIIQHFDIFRRCSEQSMTVRTTESNYNEFCKVIEECFPDTCVFDGKVDKEIYELFGGRA